MQRRLIHALVLILATLTLSSLLSAQTYSLMVDAYGNVVAPPWVVTSLGFPGNVTFKTTTNGGLIVNSLTTSQRLAVTPTNGMIVYDSSLAQLYGYTGGAWTNLGASGGGGGGGSGVTVGATSPITASTNVTGSQTNVTVGLSTSYGTGITNYINSEIQEVLTNQNTAVTAGVLAGAIVPTTNASYIGPDINPVNGAAYLYNYPTFEINFPGTNAVYNSPPITNSYGPTNTPFQFDAMGYDALHNAWVLGTPGGFTSVSNDMNWSNGVNPLTVLRYNNNIPVPPGYAANYDEFSVANGTIYTCNVSNFYVGPGPNFALYAQGPVVIKCFDASTFASNSPDIVCPMPNNYSNIVNGICFAANGYIYGAAQCTYTTTWPGLSPSQCIIVWKHDGTLVGPMNLSRPIVNAQGLCYNTNDGNIYVTGSTVTGAGGGIMQVTPQGKVTQVMAWTGTPQTRNVQGGILGALQFPYIGTHTNWLYGAMSWYATNAAAWSSNTVVAFDLSPYRDIVAADPSGTINFYSPLTLRNTNMWQNQYGSSFQSDTYSDYLNLPGGASFRVSGGGNFIGLNPSSPSITTSTGAMGLPYILGFNADSISFANTLTNGTSGQGMDTNGVYANSLSGGWGSINSDSSGGFIGLNGQITWDNNGDLTGETATFNNYSTMAGYFVDNQNDGSFFTLSASGVISGDGSGLMNLNASALTGGPVPLSVLPLSTNGLVTTWTTNGFQTVPIGQFIPPVQLTSIIASSTSNLVPVACGPGDSFTWSSYATSICKSYPALVAQNLPNVVGWYIPAANFAAQNFPVQLTTNGNPDLLAGDNNWWSGAITMNPYKTNGAGITITVTNAVAANIIYAPYAGANSFLTAIVDGGAITSNYPCNGTSTYFSNVFLSLGSPGNHTILLTNLTGQSVIIGGVLALSAQPGTSIPATNGFVIENWGIGGHSLNAGYSTYASNIVTLLPKIAIPCSGYNEENLSMATTTFFSNFFNVCTNLSANGAFVIPMTEPQGAFTTGNTAISNFNQQILYTLTNSVMSNSFCLRWDNLWTTNEATNQALGFVGNSTHTYHAQDAGYVNLVSDLILPGVFGISSVANTPYSFGSVSFPAPVSVNGPLIVSGTITASNGVTAAGGVFTGLVGTLTNSSGSPVAFQSDTNNLWHSLGNASLSNSTAFQATNAALTAFIGNGTASNLVPAIAVGSSGTNVSFSGNTTNAASTISGTITANNAFFGNITITNTVNPAPQISIISSTYTSNSTSVDYDWFITNFVTASSYNFNAISNAWPSYVGGVGTNASMSFSISAMHGISSDGTVDFYMNPQNSAYIMWTNNAGTVGKLVGTGGTYVTGSANAPAYNGSAQNATGCAMQFSTGSATSTTWDIRGHCTLQHNP